MTTKEEKELKIQASKTRTLNFAINKKPYIAVRVGAHVSIYESSTGRAVENVRYPTVRLAKEVLGKVSSSKKAN